MRHISDPEARLDRVTTLDSSHQKTTPGTRRREDPTAT
jgi:hypothetical protein